MLEFSLEIKNGILLEVSLGSFEGFWLHDMLKYVLSVWHLILRSQCLAFNFMEFRAHLLFFFGVENESQNQTHTIH